MTYLQLCQRTATECGVASNSAIAAVMPTVVGATGSLGRVVNWVGDAWREIQTFHEDWVWMRSSSILGRGFSFTTVAGQASYPLGTGPGTVGIPWTAFGKWDEEAFRCQTTTVGFENEMFLDEIPFDSRTKWAGPTPASWTETPDSTCAMSLSSSIPHTKKARLWSQSSSSKPLTQNRAGKPIAAAMSRRV
jgi:hypothetical protein